MFSKVSEEQLRYYEQAFATGKLSLDDLIALQVDVPAIFAELRAARTASGS